MSEPIRRTGLKAPIGSVFIIQWTTDAYVNCVNKFKIFGESELKSIEGRKPKPPEKKSFPQIIRGDVVCTTTIKLDGKENGFRPEMPAPKSEERGKFTTTKAVYTHVYSARFLARKVGKYEFTTVVEGTIDKTTERQEFITEVEVTPEEPISQKRKDLIATAKRWMPSSIRGAKTIPNGNKDLFDRTGWSETVAKTWQIPNPPRKKGDSSAITFETIPPPPSATFTQSASGLVSANGLGHVSAAQSSFNKNVLPGRQATWDRLVAEDKAAHDGALVDMAGIPRPTAIPVTTSCNSIANELVTIWGGTFPVDLYVMAPDKQHPLPAYYKVAKTVLAADPTALPKPGDIIYLAKPNSTAEFAHVCILVSRSSNTWVTADGGGGALPDQTAMMVDKPVEMSTGKVPIPMILSVTDGQNKPVHGWIDLDLAPHPDYDAAGNKK